MLHRRSNAWFLALLLPMLNAAAEQSVTSGDYTLHYSAFTTDTLQAEVAKAYQIERSNKTGLINVAVLKKVMGTTGQPMRAAVSATATNLHGQVQNLQLRELADHGAIYYLSEFPVSNEEVLKFHVEAKPEGETQTISADFDQEFYTN
jgi:hypothetical protein